jgi:hypothetical protein
MTLPPAPCSALSAAQLTLPARDLLQLTGGSVFVSPLVQFSLSPDNLDDEDAGSH